MFPKPEAPDGYDQVDIDCQHGSIENVTSDKEDLYDQVLNWLLDSNPDFNGKINVDGQNVMDNRGKVVVYVPGQDKIPGNFQVVDLFNLAAKMPAATKQQLQRFKQDHQDMLKKRLSKLSPGQRYCILVELCKLKNAKIYVIRDFKPILYGKSLMLALDKLRSLKKSGALILCLSEIFIAPDKSYNYYYDSKEKKYINLENDID
jgi:hypothetical protein